MCGGAGPLCLFWTIWKARNKFAFEDATLSIQKLSPLLCISSGPRLHYALKRALQHLLSSFSVWDLCDFTIFVAFSFCWVIFGDCSFLGSLPIGCCLCFVGLFFFFFGYLWCFCGVMVCFLVLSMSCHFGGSPLEYLLLSYQKKKKKKRFCYSFALTLQKNLMSSMNFK